MHLIIKIVVFLLLLITISWTIVVAIILRSRRRNRHSASTTYSRGHALKTSDEHDTAITKYDLQVLRRLVEKGYVDLLELEASLGEAKTEIVKRLKKLEKIGVIASKNDEFYVAVDDVWKLLEKMREKYLYS